MNVGEFERRFNALGKEMAELVVEFSAEASRDQQRAIAKVLDHLIRASTDFDAVVRTFRPSAGVEKLGKQTEPGRARATR